MLMSHAVWWLLGAWSVGAGPAQGAARRGPERTGVLVMPVMAVAGGSTSTGQALAQLLASALQERAELDVTLYEPAVYVPNDPLVAVLARCTEERCMMELGRRLGFQEVVGGTLEGDPGTLKLVRVSSEDGRTLGRTDYALSDTVVANLANDPAQMALALYPRAQRPGSPARSSAATGPRPGPEDSAPQHSSASGDPQAQAPPARAPTKDALGLARPWLRPAGAAALGAAGALLVVSVVVLAGYAAVWSVDQGTARQTGRHAMTQRMAALVDVTFGATLLLLGVMLPLGVGGAAALAAGLLL